MRNFIWVFLFFVFVNCHAQNKTVRGYVYDNQTGKPISGVEITTDFFGNDTTDDRGHFKVKVPENYKDTLVFSHRNYFPFVYTVKTSVPIVINLIPFGIGIDTVFNAANDSCKILKGKVFDKESHLDLESASVMINRQLTVSKTNRKGVFRATFPIQTDSITISLKGYKTRTVHVRKKHWRGYLIPVALQRLSDTINNTAWKLYRNAILYSPNELFNMGIGIRYSYLISNKLSAGVHTTFYFQSLTRNRNRNADNRYDGVKLAPFVHLYIYRNLDNDFYIEFKIIAGYFSSDKILYYYDNDIERYSDAFWTGGIGISVGNDWYLNRKVNLGLLLGFQVLPNMAPSSIEVDGIKYVRGDNAIFPFSNWYFAGSGSVIEIKFLIGGIF